MQGTANENATGAFILWPSGQLSIRFIKWLSLNQSRSHCDFHQKAENWLFSKCFIDLQKRYRIPVMHCTGSCASTLWIWRRHPAAWTITNVVSPTHFNPKITSNFSPIQVKPSPVPELSFLPAPYRGWTRAGERESRITCMRMLRSKQSKITDQYQYLGNCAPTPPITLQANSNTKVVFYWDQPFQPKAV